MPEKTLKENAIENLKTLHKIAEDNGIEFCLMDGTLLGAYRDKDFCVNDEDDIDIGILDDHYDEMTLILTDKLEEEGFEIYKSLLYKGKMEGIGIRRGGSHFDIIRINKHPEREECFNYGRGGNGVLAFVYPSKHHEGFEEIEFFGMKFKTPKDPEGFLTARYGDWHTKIDRPAFDWFTQANNNSIKTEYDQL